MELTSHHQPAGLCWGGGLAHRYVFAGKDLTAEALIQHEKDFFEGTLSPTLQSEEDKPSNMKAPVKVITGKSFQKHVVESGKDVLLELYAPWCGHCKSLAPKSTRSWRRSSRTWTRS